MRSKVSKLSIGLRINRFSHPTFYSMLSNFHEYSKTGNKAALSISMT